MRKEKGLKNRKLGHRENVVKMGVRDFVRVKR